MKSSEAEWRIIPGFDGRYSISSEGTVRNNETGRDVAVWERCSRDGKPYHAVCLHFGKPQRLPSGKHSRRRVFFVHRLMLAVWERGLLDLPSGTHAHHRDRDRLNNTRENLQLVDGREHVAAHASGDARLEDGF